MSGLELFAFVALGLLGWAVFVGLGIWVGCNFGAANERINRHIADFNAEHPPREATITAIDECHRRRDNRQPAAHT